MIIRSAKDIPDEIKNIVELYYVRNAELALREAAALKQKRPEMRDLIDCVLKLMRHAPESVFMFYDELITLYSNSGAREDIPVSVDDLMSDNGIEDIGPLDIPLLDALSLDGLDEESVRQDASQIDDAFCSILNTQQRGNTSSEMMKSIPSLLESSALAALDDSKKDMTRNASPHKRTFSPNDNFKPAQDDDRQKIKTFRKSEVNIDIDIDFDSLPVFDNPEESGIHIKETMSNQAVPERLGDITTNGQADRVSARFASGLRKPNDIVADAHDALTPVPAASLSDIIRSSRRAQALGESEIKTHLPTDRNNETRPNVGALNPYLSDSGRPLNPGGVVETSRQTFAGLQCVKPAEAPKPTMAGLPPVAAPSAGTASPDELEPLSRIPRLKCSMAQISQRTDVNPRAGFILSLIDGFTSITDILDISAWPEPETAFILLELQKQGIVDFD